MKHASILLLAIGLCGLSFAACAEGDDTAFGNQPTGGNGGEGGSAVTKPPTSSSSSSSSGGEVKVCVSSCKTDDECASSCEPPKAGINCCDYDQTNMSGTKTCYISGASVCPSKGGSSSSSGGMYP